MTPQQDKLKLKFNLTAEEVAELTRAGVVFPAQLRACAPESLPESVRAKVAHRLPQPVEKPGEG